METIQQGERTEGAGDIGRQVREGPQGGERVPARGAAGGQGCGGERVLARGAAGAPGEVRGCRPGEQWGDRGVEVLRLWRG